MLYRVVAAALVLAPLSCADANVARVASAPEEVGLELLVPAPGCYATGTQHGTRWEAVAISRAQNETCPIQAGEQVCTTNQSCVTEKGWLIQGSRTQYFANASSPADQTMNSLPVASYTAWVKGSGLLSLSLSSGAGTGLPCTVTSASPCYFSVSAIGNVTATVAGTITRAQVENAPFASTFMPTAGLRLGDLTTAPLTRPLSVPWCVSVTAKPYAGSWDVTETSRGLALLGPTQSSPNAAMLYLGDTTIFFGVTDGAAVLRWVTCPKAPYLSGASALGSSEHEFTVCSDGTTPRVWIDGASAFGCALSGSGTMKWTASPTTVTIGDTTTGAYAGAYISRFVIAKNSDGGAVAAASWVTEVQTTAVACLGDSITYGLATPGVTTAYPTTLAALLGAPWITRNFGVGGINSDQILAMWMAGPRRQGFGTVVVEGGINDMASSRTAATAFGYLSSIYGQARAYGARLVPVTSLPWRGSANFTEAKETQRLALNQMIRDYCTANGITCVDAAADFDDGTGTLKAAYDSGDHLHPSQAGANRLAALVRTALP